MLQQGRDLSKTILIVEDVGALAEACALQLKSVGFQTLIADCADAAMEKLAKFGQEIDAILLDLNLPDQHGLELLRADPRITAKWPVIVMTGDGSINRAIDAMRLGAYDFLVKPVAGARLLKAVESAFDAHWATKLRAAPARALPSATGYLGFVGASPPMQAVYRQVAKVAQSKAPVFICGESGTGKEVCAESIHKASARNSGQFVPINCGAIPENLLESQIFGHLKGAFTGAVSNQVGAAQRAHKGTLFLDEICELDLKLQVKLLRFLQTGEALAVGSSKAEQVDVRIICATNRNVAEEVKAGRFREDLFYRLSVIPIDLPPLRERGDDCILLAEKFLSDFAAEEGKSFGPLPETLQLAIRASRWPGNVRELQNVMRRAAVMNDGPDLIALSLPDAERIDRMSSDEQRGTLCAFRGKTLDEIERSAIDIAIQEAAGSLPLAARNLGISPSTLYRKRERWFAAC